MPELFETRFENEVGCGEAAEQRVVLGQNGGSLAWGNATEPLRLVKNAHLQTTVAKWFPSGGVCLSGGSDTLVKVWDAEEEEEQPREEGEEISVEPAAVLSGQHRRGILSAAMIGRGRSLATGARDGSVVWDVSTQQATRTLSRADEVWSLACLADEHVMAAGGVGGRGVLHDLRSAATPVGLSVGSESAGALTCAAIVGNAIQFGTDGGWVVEFDIRNVAAPALVQCRRDDGARITALFGAKGGFATSLGGVVTGAGSEERQVAEVGQTIVAVSHLANSGGGHLAIASDKLIWF